MKSPVLCSDNQMSCGKVVTKPAMAAPAPSETSSAGSAQQSRVLPLVKSDKNDAATLCFSPASSVARGSVMVSSFGRFDLGAYGVKAVIRAINRFHHVARIGDFGFDGGVRYVLAVFE